MLVAGIRCELCSRFYSHRSDEFKGGYRFVNFRIGNGAEGRPYGLRSITISHRLVFINKGYTAAAAASGLPGTGKPSFLHRSAISMLYRRAAFSSMIFLRTSSVRV